MRLAYIDEHTLLPGLATKIDFEDRNRGASITIAPEGIVELARGKRASRILVAKRVGTAVVVFERGAERSEDTVTVVDEPGELLPFRYEPGFNGRLAGDILFLGERARASVTLRTPHRSYALGADNVTWSSSDPTVMRVDDGSALIPISEGAVKLIAACPRLGLRREEDLRVAERPNVEWF